MAGSGWQSHQYMWEQEGGEAATRTERERYNIVAGLKGRKWERKRLGKKKVVLGAFIEVGREETAGR